MALKYFESTKPQNTPEYYGIKGGEIGTKYIGPRTTYTTTYESRRGPNGEVFSAPKQVANTEEGFYTYNRDTGMPTGWTSFAEQAKQNQERSKFNQKMQREQRDVAEAKFRAGQELDSRGFSRNFLEYLQGAREKKLQQAGADIEKTGAETGLLGAQTSLTGAQASRISQLTPFEAQQMEAQSGLYGAQASKLGAETLSEFGLTAPSQASMFAAYAGGRANLMGGQARLMEAGGSTTIKMNTPFGERVSTSPNYGGGGFFGGVPMGGAPMGGVPMGGYGGQAQPFQGYSPAQSYSQAQQRAKQLGGSLTYFSPTASGGYESITRTPPPTRKPLGNYRGYY